MPSEDDVTSGYAYAPDNFIGVFTTDTFSIFQSSSQQVYNFIKMKCVLANNRMYLEKHARILNRGFGRCTPPVRSFCVSCTRELLLLLLNILMHSP